MNKGRFLHFRHNPEDTNGKNDRRKSTGIRDAEGRYFKESLYWQNRKNKGFDP